VVFYHFEWLHFCEHRCNHCLVVHIFEALMESERHNPVSMDPRLPEQKVVGRVGINDLARHFLFQISNLTPETNLAQKMTTPGVEAIYGCSRS